MKNLIISLVVGLLYAGLATEKVQTYLPFELSLPLILGSISVLITYLLTEELDARKEAKQKLGEVVDIKIPEILEGIRINHERFWDEKKKYIANKLNDFRSDALSSSAAFGASSEKFHKALLEVSSSQESKKWLLMKFIALKLGSDFTDISSSKLSFKSNDGLGIDDILGELVTECSKEVVFSFPYTPKNWVEGVKEYKALCDRCHKEKPCVIVDKIIREDLLPQHLARLKNSQISKKMRYVTVKWSHDEDEKCYVDVLMAASLIGGIETKFIDVDKCEGDPSRFDINILDDLLIKYDRHNGNCELYLDQVDIVKESYAFSKTEKSNALWEEAERRIAMKFKSVA